MDKALEAIQTSVKIKESAATLEKEIPISKYEKYRVCKKDEKIEAENEEDFDWYDCNSPSTYFCLTMENT